MHVHRRDCIVACTEVGRGGDKGHVTISIIILLKAFRVGAPRRRRVASTRRTRRRRIERAHQLLDATLRRRRQPRGLLLLGLLLAPCDCLHRIIRSGAITQRVGAAGRGKSLEDLGVRGVAHPERARAQPCRRDHKSHVALVVYVEWRRSRPPAGAPPKRVPRLALVAGRELRAQGANGRHVPAVEFGERPAHTPRACVCALTRSLEDRRVYRLDSCHKLVRCIPPESAQVVVALEPLVD